MLNISLLRGRDNAKIVALGSHPGILQSILDFDYLSGKSTPSITSIIAGGRKVERYFFGKKEILIPVFSSVSEMSKDIGSELSYFLNVNSGRRVLSSTREILRYSSIQGGVIFAENVPEKHSLELLSEAEKNQKFIIGPASVGLLLPGVLKLGAIGGVDARQLVSSHVMTQGSVAVFSASGGMTNEIISLVARSGKRLSFALSFGGDRFPILSPKDAFLAAEKDQHTKTIVYFGELGGTDEYDLVALLKEKKVTKEVICYIGGTVAELFETPPQFGHAKAMASTYDETARAKRDSLKKVGAKVAETFAEFITFIESIPSVSNEKEKEYTSTMTDLSNRRRALITTSISQDVGGDATILGEELLVYAKSHSFAWSVSSLFLGRPLKSEEFEEFTDFVLRLLVDHGPYVSGAVNTIVTARAGRDLVSSLAAGLLTIGPRFGGAINQAATNWLTGVFEDISASAFVENFAQKKEYISGIGHKKYRVDLPDPRVKELLSYVEKLEHRKFTTYALAIEKITVGKKGNLILNVDGAIAAVLLDILSEKEGLSEGELKELTKTEFFNALFVLSRSVGFIAHFLDQKRLDEGLFRLDGEHVTSIQTKRNE